jgi:hypothetical protein
MHTVFWLENLKVRYHSGDLGIDGKIGCEGVDWMHLAQDRDQWWALVNTGVHMHMCVCGRRGR